jgi:hypothetical protein
MRFKIILDSYTWKSISCLYSFMGQALVAVPTDRTVVSHDSFKV